MSTTSDSSPTSIQPAIPSHWTLADLQHLLGDVPAERIRVSPPIGLATEQDVVRIEDREGRFYELDHGVLVEKPRAWYESILAILIATELSIHVQQHDLGQVLGENGSLMILPGVVKIPDVSFVSWARFPKHKLPRCPIPALIPDLAVEVLSQTNSPGK